MPVLAELFGELADRRRLPRAVDADDEHDARAFPHCERRGLAEQHRDLVRQRGVQITDLAARLEPAHELCCRANADVGANQRFFEPLPRELVAGIERGGSELLRERAATLRQGLAEA